MAGDVVQGRARRAHTDQFKGFRQMMGTIVLSMLLGWFGIVTALMIFSGGREEAVVEESA